MTTKMKRKAYYTFRLPIWTTRRIKISAKTKRRGRLSDRRKRQNEPRASEKAQQKEYQTMANELQDLSEAENRNLKANLNIIHHLTKNPDSSNNNNNAQAVAVDAVMKTLCGGGKRRDYRMVWANSARKFCLC